MIYLKIDGDHSVVISLKSLFYVKGINYDTREGESHTSPTHKKCSHPKENQSHIYILENAICHNYKAMHIINSFLR